MTTTDERFEERLLSELSRIVAERPAPAAPAPAAPPRQTVRLTRSRLAIGAAATVAATAVAAIVLAAGDTSTPAYAVEPAADGSVTVEINSLRDASGLEHKLREAGIPAVVDYVPDGKACREPRFRSADAGAPRSPANARRSMSLEVRDGSARFTIPRGGVRSGETLVIVSSLGAAASSVSTEIAAGPVAPCELVDAPPFVEAVPIPPTGEIDGSRAAPSHRAAPERGTAEAGPSTSVAPEPGGTADEGPSTSVAPDPGGTAAAGGANGTNGAGD